MITNVYISEYLMPLWDVHLYVMVLVWSYGLCDLKYSTLVFFNLVRNYEQMVCNYTFCGIHSLIHSII